jgi:hypothetical protein
VKAAAQHGGFVISLEPFPSSARKLAVDLKGAEDEIGMPVLGYFERLRRAGLDLQSRIFKLCHVPELPGPGSITAPLAAPEQ